MTEYISRHDVEGEPEVRDPEGEYPTRASEAADLAREEATRDEGEAACREAVDTQPADEEAESNRA